MIVLDAEVDQRNGRPGEHHAQDPLQRHKSGDAQPRQDIQQDDDAFLIPAGARHNVVNTGKKTLHVYTIYGPPEHIDGTVHATKADADKSSEHFNGKTTE